MLQLLGKAINFGNMCLVEESERIEWLYSNFFGRLVSKKNKSGAAPESTYENLL